MKILLGTFLVCVGAIVVGLSTVWSGFVLSVLWAWFVVPVFHISAISVLQAAGLALTVRLTTYVIDIKKTEFATQSTESQTKSYIANIIAHVLAPLFALIVGWIIHSFI